MSGYTKGPWEAETTEATMNDRNEWRIGPRSKPQVVRGVMSTADARLIAAAPRLAEALKKIAESGNDRLSEMARAALREAGIK